MFFPQRPRTDSPRSETSRCDVVCMGMRDRRLDSRAHLRNCTRMTPRTWHAALLAMVLLAAAVPALAQHRVYPAPEPAAADLAGALKVAAAQHRRVLLDFGGDWCTDCLVLDSYF